MKEQAQEIANRILGGEELYIQLEDDHARDIDNALTVGGFKERETHSACSKAWYEAHLERDDLKVDITATAFMGTFTEVRAFR